jgi:hypothetical protein
MKVCYLDAADGQPVGEPEFACAIHKRASIKTKPLAGMNSVAWSHSYRHV